MAEEEPYYEIYRWGMKKITWVESQEMLVQYLHTLLAKKANHEVIHATVWDQSGIKKLFHHTSNSQSSSLFQLGGHLNYFPEIVETSSETVTTIRLDEILNKNVNYDFINLDLQGSELQAIKSLGNMIINTKYIYTEVNRSEVYIDCSKIWEIDEYLDHHGFQRIATRWAYEQDWGDAVYAKKKNIIQILSFKLINIYILLITKIRYLLHKFKLAILKNEA